MENYSRVFQKQKRKKTHEETEFHYLIKDWVFTNLYTSCRKVLGKMPVNQYFYTIANIG